MSQSTSELNLLDLPADVQQLILSAFHAPIPLFTPIYTLDTSDYEAPGDLRNKHMEYYGQRSDDVLASSKGLLSLSSTCRYFRELLAPTVFYDVVLRPKAKSVASVTLLSTTPHWKHVKSLTFAGTHVYGSDDGVDPLEGFNFESLSTLLSNLPPTLQQLSLDFPSDWVRECNEDYLEVFDEDEPPEKTLELEAEDTWRKLLFTVLDAVAKNDWSSREGLELKLLNVPPLPCSVYWSEEFYRMLNHVTGFTLGLDHFDNGAGWNMNTMNMPESFGSNLGDWFWNHLGAARSLRIHADNSWPIGLAPGRCHIPLGLPREDIRLTNLEELDLKWWLVDSELITFMTTNMPNLRQLSIACYYADGENRSSEAAETPSWAEFFTALSKHPRLKRVNFYPHLSGMRILFPYGPTDKTPDEAKTTDTFRKVWGEIKQQQAEKGAAGERDLKTELRMKRLWPHVHLDDKYGMIFGDEDYSVERYCEGADHEAWLVLCDVMERRGGGCSLVEIKDPTERE